MFIEKSGWGPEIRTPTQGSKDLCPAIRRVPNLAPRQRFELQLNGSEPFVLPLDDLGVSAFMNSHTSQS